jgi:hypothetical protein
MVVDWWERAGADASGEEKGEARRSGGGGRAADSIGSGAQGESTVQSICKVPPVWIANIFIKHLRATLAAPIKKQ